MKKHGTGLMAKNNLKFIELSYNGGMKNIKRRKI